MYGVDDTGMGMLFARCKVAGMGYFMDIAYLFAYIKRAMEAVGVKPSHGLEV